MSKINATNIVTVNVDEIKPYWHNPRKNDKTVEKLMKSIQEFGFNVPLVVNKDMVLITGHARLKASKKLGIKEVPCVVVDLTDEQAKKYCIADNKIQESTEWDEESLFKELREIGNPMDLVDIGFSVDEIKDIVGDIDSLLDEATSIEFAQTTGYAVQQPVYSQPQPVHAIATTNVDDDDNYNETYQSSLPTQATTSEFIQTPSKSMEDIESQLRQREQELNGRFVKESYEQTKYQNVVVCPHCGQQFIVRGVK